MAKCRTEAECTGKPWCKFTGCAKVAQAHNKLENLRRRVNRARDFPAHTCPASRHVHMMADRLAAGKVYDMFTEEPKHCAGSLYSVLESLWKARAELERLKAKQPPLVTPPAGPDNLGYCGACGAKLPCEVHHQGNGR